MPIVYALIIALFVSQAVMVVMGVIFCKSMSGIINVSPNILAPTIAVLCVVGSFALRTSYFDVGFMVAFGVIGYFMKKSDYPVFATVLGLVLGRMSDENLIRTAIRFRYDFSVFLTRPISLALVIFTVIMVLYPLVMSQIRKRKNKAA
jgi:putative tricarboxylic transport membrane protein